MSIRLRSIFLVILTNLLIILFSVIAGTYYVRENILSSQETDLSVVADIADHFISSEIESLQLKASIIASTLSSYDETEWNMLLLREAPLYPEFIGMSIISAQRGLITSTGEEAAQADILEDSFINQVFNGGTFFTSTYPSGSGMVFYYASLISSEEETVLILTLPGMYFSDLVSTFTIWETGHIFMTDDEGNIIANIREAWVQNRLNFMRMAETDDSYNEVASVLRRIVNGESGIGYFSTDGVPRLCSFRPISSSAQGWSMGIIAPLPESPFRDIDRGLLVVGFVAIILSITAAIIASAFIKKPFEEIAALKEEAERNSRYKSTFLANMSHEMRTPLNVVVGLTNLRMEEVDLSDGVLEDLKKINSAGELLLSIVNDVLDISKIEAGRLDLMPINYYTASILNDIITFNIIRMEEKPLQFLIDIDENFPEELNGDELRVKQILNNLLSNAFKYTKEGIIKLIAECNLTEDGNFLLTATVSDTGIGIREEDLKKIFSEYNQVDTKANRNIEGTGLGLAITKNLVEMMGGEISVESVYGVGTSFSVSIKQGYINDKKLGKEMIDNLKSFRYSNEKQHNTSKLVRPDYSYARVLVVDDFQTNLYVAAGLLGKYKMLVDCVTNGQEAIDLIKSGMPHYDLVFMDHMMPKMDGIEATNIIRSLETEYASKLPIVALTANALTGNEKMFLEEGFNAFLSKPIDIYRLDSILKQWLQSEKE